MRVAAFLLALIGFVSGVGIGSGIVMLGDWYIREKKISFLGVLNIIIGLAIAVCEACFISII